MKNEVYIKNEKIQGQLNGLLSDYQVYYQNLRAFHWLVAGPQFYQLHEKFEEFYDEAAEDIDEIAERILMIGGKPLHTFRDYLEHATLKARKNPAKPAEMVPAVIADMEYLLGAFRVITDMAAEAGDEGTVALMSEFISKTEKKLWMLNSIQSA
jgi:starvation-inducible DNA-binding protein